MKELLMKFKTRLTSPETDFEERKFLLLNVCAEVVVFLVCMGDLLLGEDIVEIAVLAFILTVAPFSTYYSIKNNKIERGAMFISISIVFLIMPVTFFFGGGLYGGSVIWFSFCFLHIGLSLSGTKRKVMLVLLGLLILTEYALAFFHPHLIRNHSIRMFYLDSMISVVLVGVIIYITIYFQNLMFINENKRVREQARHIEELNRSQNRFFSSMSHEIRTPINTIIGLNEMILREDISDEVAEDARNIQSASRILLALINDILDMSKIESGKMEIVPVIYDVGRMLSEIVNMIWGKAQEKGLEFSLDVDPSLPAKLYSDEVRIKQILINILNNAVKYTQEGSVVLSIHCHRTEQGRALVTYSVEDTGSGIKSENIPILFDAFKRVDEEKNRYIEGTGLGLSIVKQLVDLLGGEISVNSIYTRGTTFVVSIEQEIAEEAVIGKFDLSHFRDKEERTGYHQSFEAPDAKVLIVDDNSSNLLVATKLLRQTKVKCTTAGSGEEALAKTLVEHYDAIFMDHMMPEMDGIECLEAIRAQTAGLCRNTPVIVLTANAGSENQLLYRNAGFDDYLIKPVDGESLETALLEALPQEKVTLSRENVTHFDSDVIVREMRRKIPLLITTDSVSDLPDELLKSYKIPVIPYKVITEDGVFYDGIEAEGEVILRSLMKRGSRARSDAPEVEEYEQFFAKQLDSAQHILHISMAKHTSKGYENASEAALSFYNVRVLDSGHLSSGMGMIVMAAKEAADSAQNDLNNIVPLLEQRISRIQTSFIVDSTEFLARSGRISESVHRILSALLVHPMIEMKDYSMSVGGIFMGSKNSSYLSYIQKVLKKKEGIDTSVLFITYAGMKREELEEIKRQVLKRVPFEKIYLQKASPAVSINCGPGSFGLIFARK